MEIVKTKLSLAQTEKRLRLALECLKELEADMTKQEIVNLTSPRDMYHVEYYAQGSWCNVGWYDDQAEANQTARIYRQNGNDARVTFTTNGPLRG